MNNINKDELDFNRRLLAIYKFKNNQQFWGEESPICENALYPNDDVMKEICNKIKGTKYYLSDKSNKSSNTKLLGDFLTLWSNVENYYNCKNTNNNLILDKSYVDDESYLRTLRAFRNKVIHKPELIKDSELINNINILKSLLDNKKI